MVEALVEYLKTPEWRRQHRWRKAIWHTMSQHRPDRHPRAAAQPPLGRDPRRKMPLKDSIRRSPG